MQVTSNDIAALAIVAGLVGIGLSGWYQRGLATDQYQRDRLTETYLQLLEAAYIRMVAANEAFSLGPGASSVLAELPNAASEDERQFSAKVRAYASSEVARLWQAFNEATTDLLGVLYQVRQETGMVPESVPGVRDRPDVKAADASWNAARTALESRVRIELGTTKRRPWRGFRNPKTHDALSGTGQNWR
jgi:hypothetical protein